MNDDFADIRPYRDEEVEFVLQQLLQDRDFLDAIARFRLNWLHRTMPALARATVKWRLGSGFKNYQSIRDIQLSVENYMDHCLQTSAAEVTVDGVDKLDAQTTYLFLCNHRDIVMDPALCNLFLHKAGRDTFRIAIGDNLLKREYSSHLMRLNKSFIVKRSIESRREKLLELKRLSAYIRQSLNRDNQSVWIAHREGRSKDGWDKTDTALLKMLNLSGEKTASFGEKSAELRMVPTSISYEWDPCDRMKAIELAALERSGSYSKSEFEDVNSIAHSILDAKGDIHVSFGQVLGDEFDSAEALAIEVDRQIIGNYRQHKSNLAAYRLLEGHVPDAWALADRDFELARTELERRCEGLDELERNKLLQSYANPVRNWLRLHRAI